MENYKRPTPDSAATQNGGQDDDDVDGDLLLPREGERAESRHPRYSSCEVYLSYKVYVHK